MKRGQVLSAGRAPKRALHHVLSTIGQFRCVFANTVAPGSPPELSSLISNVVSICFPHFKMLLHSYLNHFCWWLLCTFSETNSSRDQSLFMMSQTQGIQPFGASHVVFTSQCSFTVLEITFANGKNTFDLIFVFVFCGGGTFQQWSLLITTKIQHFFLPLPSSILSPQLLHSWIDFFANDTTLFMMIFVHIFRKRIPAVTSLYL